MENKVKFPGFPPAPVTNYWPYPKALNGWWYTLTPTEQKVLDYILRHTWGYKKVADAIAHSQFIKGIVKRDGTVIDKGTGIRDERTVRKSLKGLEKKGFITSEPITGKETVYLLNIDPSQEMIPVSENDRPPVSNNDTSHPSQTLLPTINDLSIKDNNTISSRVITSKKNSKEKIQTIIGYLSSKLGTSFPNYGKQAHYTKSMLIAGFSVDDIRWAIDKMLSEDWWREHSFDMKNVADEIPKLMTRTFKKGNRTS